MLNRLESGAGNQHDLDAAHEAWNARAQALDALSAFNLEFELDFKIANLSGGQLTRLMLARAFFDASDFLLLDEPTNNLDEEGRAHLFRALDEYRGGVLLATHDRALLRRVSTIFELKDGQLERYGGNYESFVIQRNAKISAAIEKNRLARQNLKTAKAMAQLAKERQERRSRAGARSAKVANQAPIMLGQQRQRSEATRGRSKKLYDNKVLSATERLTQTEKNVPRRSTISFDIPDPHVRDQQRLVSLKDITFGYDRPLFSHFDLEIYGRRRIAICGSNGTGKSTLLRIIAGQIAPTSGRVDVMARPISFLDQHTDSLHSEETILQNAMTISPRITEHNARAWLALFNFRNEKVDQTVGQLSGGERMRAALACQLLSEQPPQLLVLDEPTNHMDLQSIEAMENALSHYRGAVIVVSHDTDFLRSIGIESDDELWLGANSAPHFHCARQRRTPDATT